MRLVAASCAACVRESRGASASASWAPAFVLPDLSVRNSHTSSPLSGPLLSSPAPNKPLPPPPALTPAFKAAGRASSCVSAGGGRVFPGRYLPAAGSRGGAGPPGLPASTGPAHGPAARGRGRREAEGRPASGLHGRLGREARAQQGTGTRGAAPRPEAGLHCGSRCCAAGAVQPGLCRPSLEQPARPPALPALCMGGGRRPCLAPRSATHGEAQRAGRRAAEL